MSDQLKEHKLLINSKDARDLPIWADRVIMLFIIINAVVLFLQESGINTVFVQLLDAVCIVIFIIEMIIKLRLNGFRKYWTNNWNKMDFVLVLISIPALLSYLLPVHLGFLSSVLVLRVLRVFRFTKLLDLFAEDRMSGTMPGETRLRVIVKNLWSAVKYSLPVFFVYIILIFVFALISCDMFRDLSPQYFGTPLDAIYSTFRICTTEGWYDIPDSLSAGLSSLQIAWVRVYFIFIVITGGIIGLSLVNSIFVDAMLKDNNDDLIIEVKKLSEQINSLSEELGRLSEKMKD